MSIDLLKDGDRIKLLQALLYDPRVGLRIKEVFEYYVDTSPLVKDPKMCFMDVEHPIFNTSRPSHAQGFCLTYGNDISSDLVESAIMFNPFVIIERVEPTELCLSSNKRIGWLTFEIIASDDYKQIIDDIQKNELSRMNDNVHRKNESS